MRLTHACYCVLLLLLPAGTASADPFYTFTNAGQTGRSGPTQSQLDTAYSGTSLDGLVTSSSGIQIWTVPLTTDYVIEAWGAKGGDGSYEDNPVYDRAGGLGARMQGTFSFDQGDQLQILVGQMGSIETVSIYKPGGGGGGSFVTLLDNTPLIIAGGGGGGGIGYYGQTDGDPGQVGTAGTRNGGDNGLGGAHSSLGGGGGGLIGDGTGSDPGIEGLSFVNGGLGGASPDTATQAHGGFGGGGGGKTLAGGAGGYSGGGAIGLWSGSGTAGGGGSFNGGTDQSNSVGVRADHGLVTISYAGAQAHLNWAGGSGDWGEADNWDLHVLPSAITNVSIDATGSLTVTGPNSQAAITSLVVDSQTSGASATLDLQDTGALTVSGVTTIGARARIAGDGMLVSTGGINNSGELDLGDGLRLAGGALSNHGRIVGDAQIDNTLSNESSGELRVVDGQRMLLRGIGNTNAGEINILGGSIEFDEDLTNTSTGFIGGRGLLVADGGLANSGVMAFSGTTDILGDIDNQTGGRIVTTGGVTTTFFDDLVHNGTEIRTGTGSDTVILGAAAGAGSYTGTGTVFFEGDLRPGNSTATVPFEGNLVFGSSAGLEIELEGTTPGSGHDQLQVGGQVSLGGAALNLVPGYTPDRGDSYVIVSNEMADPVVGQFAGFPDDSIFPLGGEPCQIDYQGGDGNDVELTVLYAAVTGRHIFYNNSSFDGNDTGPDAPAIATDKEALRPTQTADFDNYTSYSRGINGVMVDLAYLPDGVTFDEDNFEFKVGNDDTPGEWLDAPDTASITSGPGEDPDTTRVTIIWDDYEIRNEWLQVTVLAEGLEMPANDIFYFGNAVGEGGNSDLDAQVTTADLLLARNNPRNVTYPADVEFDYDYDRDGRVNATDVLLARNNQTNFLSRLELITAPYPTGAAMAAPVPEPSTLVLLGMGGVGLLAYGWRRRRR